MLIKTSGDQNQKSDLAGFGFQGVFVKELEEALLANQIDIAIHSLKDVPHQIPEGLELSCFFKRELPNDVLIAKVDSLEALRQGALIGTGSPRRILQLKKIRPDFRFAPLRGNIDTRLSKVEQGEFDAIILAAAGLNRLGMHPKISQIIPVEQMLPAIGQGLLCAESRTDNFEIQNLMHQISNAEGTLCAHAERDFMQRTGGGCKVPMAALAELKKGQLSLEALIIHPENANLFVRQQINFSTPKYSDSEMSDWVKTFRSKCNALKIPFPADLPDHYLLNSGGWLRADSD
jgi:hydroxymethylbilane synthase